MKPPIFVRSLTPAERTALEQGLRSANAFVVHRCQCLLHSADGLTPREIQQRVGWSDQTVRSAFHAFAAEGLACLIPKSSRPLTAAKVLDETHLAALQELLHQSPRHFGLATSHWTLRDVAQVAAAQGVTPRRVSVETIRDALQRLGVRWKRAQQWIHSPDPAYARKKGRATA